MRDRSVPSAQPYVPTDSDQHEILSNHGVAYSKFVYIYHESDHKAQQPIGDPSAEMY